MDDLEKYKKMKRITVEKDELLIIEAPEPYVVRYLDTFDGERCIDELRIDCILLDEKEKSLWRNKTAKEILADFKDFKNKFMGSV